MGRWIDKGREQQRKDWMVPEGPAFAGGEEQPEDADAGVRTVSGERRYRTPWARGPRAPLRRNQGVPAPLETPLYLHREELSRVRSHGRDPWAVLGWTLAALGVAALVFRLLQNP